MKTETRILKWTLDDEIHKNNHYQVLDEDGFRVAWVASKADAVIIAAAPETARERNELKAENERIVQNTIETLRTMQIHLDTVIKNKISVERNYNALYSEFENLKVVEENTRALNAELLAALEGIVDYENRMRANSEPKIGDGHLNKALRAIKKAKGQ